MKKPWIAGLLSVFPGLGIIVLGQVVAGIGVMAGTLLLVVLSLLTSPADISAWLISFAIILWMLQMGYAVLTAWAAAAPQESPQKTSQSEERERQREAEAIQRSAREALTPLLLPGQHLRIALNGRKAGIDARMSGELLLGIVDALLGGGGFSDVSDPPTTCVGITEDELVFAITRRIPKPSDLRRVPLSDVSLVEFKEGRWGLDKLVLDTGRPKLLHFYTAESLRPVIGELTVALSEVKTTHVPHPIEKTRAPRRQWAPILTGVLGANLGYVIAVGTFLLIIRLEFPTDTDPFLKDTAITTFMCCALPTFLPLGAISGLGTYRLAQRKAATSKTGLILALTASTLLGVVIGILIYFLGLMGAAL